MYKVIEISVPVCDTLTIKVITNIEFNPGQVWICRMILGVAVLLQVVQVGWEILIWISWEYQSFSGI